ncbi:unnamed protein product [Lupinus luteus]|uniref:Uncharacterized protein n=1 Tax=Lupinus luteus TaxID=3873 RepID=A0AAV1XWN9_LUPLU
MGRACTIDFHCLDEGFGGKTYKCKREEAQSQNDAVNDNIIDNNDETISMEIDDALPPPSKRSAVASSENPDNQCSGTLPMTV